MRVELDQPERDNFAIASSLKDKYPASLCEQCPAREFCPNCGQSPCVNPSFCALSAGAGAPDERTRLHRELLDEKVSLEAAYRRLNDPARFPTPRTMIEAILYCVRERGIAALDESKNQQRLSECDEAAKAEINRRIAKLREPKQ